MLARQIQPSGREMVYRTGGHAHGPITRLMSPSDLGEILKPFVFLDLAGFDGRFAPMPMGLGWHNTPVRRRCTRGRRRFAASATPMEHSGAHLADPLNHV